jgi:plasmid stabilization system protein ParE
MTQRFIVRPRAEDDIQAAFEWYESELPGLGNDFLSSLRQRLQSIRDAPESCAKIYGEVRRAIVSRFPYVVFYISQPTRLVVLAVLHQARNPRTWPRRQ